ncbi:MAG: hypothetical protein N2258_03360 [Brevinematales bacterium]|nr:hypothetical protein [Brevinematales bacterium]
MKNYINFLLFFLFLSCAEKSINENIIIAFDGEIQEFKVSDFTNVVGRKFKEKTGKLPKMLVVKKEGIYDEVLDNPKAFIDEFNLKNDTKYYFALSIKPIFNSLKNRIEYEMCFGTIESLNHNLEFVRGAVLSPFKVIEEFDESYFKNSENLKKIFVFGKKVDKLLTLINTNNLIGIEDKKNFSNSLVNFFDKVSSKNFVITFREVSTDILKLFKDNQIFDDEFFEDANRAFVFIISSTAKKKEEKNFYEGLFFASKADFKDVIEFDAPININSLINDFSLIVSNYADIKDNLVIYWRINPDFTGKTYVEFKKYSDFINLPGEYLLLSSIDKIMDKDFFDFKYFNEKKEEIFDKIYLRIVEKRLNNLFYDRKNQKLSKIIFFEYISTGKIIIKAVFGPVDKNKISFYIKELDKLGIKANPALFKAGEFR